MPLDLNIIEKLIQFMEKYGLNELQVREGELEFRGRRGQAREAPYVFQSAHPIVQSPAESSAGLPPVAPAAVAAKAPGKSKEICSPIVGTFYRKPNPTAAPYKEVGDRVEKEDVVCIVEAMKVMNEIRADVSGTVKKILVEDASPVEYGQALFLVEPD